MHLSQAFAFVSLTTLASGFTLNPYNLYDSFYENAVRTTLAKFHVNLSHGKYSANGPMVAPAIEWNVNGLLLISRKSFVDHLTAFNVSFHGLQVPDRYDIVDGNVGASMYRLQGKQTGEFAGITPKGRSIDIIGAELMVFDANAELNYLITVEEIGLAIEQLTTGKPVKSFSNVTLFVNPQTDPDFRQKLRDNMAMLHENYNAGQNQKNGALATKNVKINADGIDSSGRVEFVQLFASHQSSFPDMVYHDDNVLADGHVGVVESVWEGTQTGKYTAPDGTVIKPSGKIVRNRSFLFLEFNDDALITQVTFVHDENVIFNQLKENQTKILYPLYP